MILRIGGMEERKVATMSKIRPALAIIGIAVLLFTVVLAMATGIVDAKPTATRTLPAEPVSTGEPFIVRIEVSDYGAIGHVIETLPEGFLYTSSSLPTNQRKEITDEEAEKAGTRVYKFFLFGETSFTYTVTAPDSEGTYRFAGELVDMNKKKYEVGGDMKIVVEEAKEEEPTVTRILPEEPVAVGECFTVEIEASHYGFFGHIVETLPEEFVYVDSTLNTESVEVEDDTVVFSLEGEPSFSYIVTAPDEEGIYIFDGVLIDEDKDEYDISGDTNIAVVEKSGRVTSSADITAWSPIETVINNTEGESRTFNISVNQIADISWLINGTEVQTNESTREAIFANTSAVIGTWNVSVIATNTTTGLSDMHTWIWSVTLTPTATPTPAVNITSTSTSTQTPTPVPSVTPTQKSKSSPSPTSIATAIATPAPTPTPTPTDTQSAKPALPGFEAGFVFAAILALALALLLLFRKKGNDG